MIGIALILFLYFWVQDCLTPNKNKSSSETSFFIICKHLQLYEIPLPPPITGGIHPDCENIDECILNVCQNGAACLDLDGDYTCTCGTGFLGKNCSVLDRCVGHVCQHGGQCVNGVSTHIDKHIRYTHTSYSLFSKSTCCVSQKDNIW